MSYETQLRARAEILSDTSGLEMMVTVILMGASSAGVDPGVVPGVRIAIQALSDGEGVVGYEAGRKTDRYPGSGYSCDVAFLEAVREAAEAITDRRKETEKLAQEVTAAYEQACDDLDDAERALRAAYAMATDEPCNGCHGAKQAAIDAAEEAIRAAKERIAICAETAEILDPLHKRLHAAFMALCRVPHDLGETYELVYTFIVNGGKMPHYGRWVEGAGAAT